MGSPGLVNGNTIGPSDPLTTKHIERLEQEMCTVDKLSLKKMLKNSKSIPSLDTITTHYTCTCTLTETMEDPKTPNVMIKTPEHHLQQLWKIYHDTKAAGMPPTTVTVTFPAPAEAMDYEAGLAIIGKFDPALLNCSWQWLTMALIGKELDEGDKICVAMVSLRSKVCRGPQRTQTAGTLPRRLTTNSNTQVPSTPVARAHTLHHCAYVPTALVRSPAHTPPVPPPLRPTSPMRLHRPWTSSNVHNPNAMAKCEGAHRHAGVLN
ncbi:hypothetical protein OF83DRAFT_1176582 [Amylostereum chailletii]|nr:hypothetical protein OF83DRAFT_1176582 [Amylostereum chailletii]